MSVYKKLDPMVEHRTQICRQRQESAYSQSLHAQYSIPKSTH